MNTRYDEAEDSRIGPIEEDLGDIARDFYNSGQQFFNNGRRGSFHENDTVKQRRQQQPPPPTQPMHSRNAYDRRGSL